MSQNEPPWRLRALSEVRTVHSRARSAVKALQRLLDEDRKWYGDPDEAELQDMIFQLKQSITHLEKWERKRSISGAQVGNCDEPTPERVERNRL
jgi:hypothetical protein